MKSRHLMIGAAAAAALVGSGCSAHQDPPATPVVQAATPTNRGTVNSWELAMGEIHTSPGSFANQPLPQLPKIVVPAGFEPSDPVAVSVYSALVADKKIETKFIATSAKDGTVVLQGVVGDAGQKSKAEAIAKGVTGVKKVVDQLTVVKQPPTA